MDQLENHDYYIARAASARKLALRAANPAIAAIHKDMATRYEMIAAQVWQAMVQPGGVSQAA